MGTTMGLSVALESGTLRGVLGMAGCDTKLGVSLGTFIVFSIGAGSILDCGDGISVLIVWMLWLSDTDNFWIPLTVAVSALSLSACFDKEVCLPPRTVEVLSLSSRSDKVFRVSTCADRVFGLSASTDNVLALSACTDNMLSLSCCSDKVLILPSCADEVLSLSAGTDWVLSLSGCTDNAPVKTLAGDGFRRPPLRSVETEAPLGLDVPPDVDPDDKAGRLISGFSDDGAPSRFAYAEVPVLGWLICFDVATDELSDLSIISADDTCNVV